MKPMTWLVRRVARGRRRPPAPPGPYSRLTLQIHQRGQVLELRIETGWKLRLSALWARDVRGGEYALGELSRSPGRRGELKTWIYRADIDLSELGAPAENDDAADAGAGNVCTVDMEITEDRRKPPRYAGHVEYVHHEGRVADGVQTGRELRYHAPLGRFRHTQLYNVRPVRLADGRLVRPYINRLGHLGLAIDRCVQVRRKVRLERLKVVAGTLEMAGTLDVGSSPVESARMVILGREVSLRTSDRARLTYDEVATARSFGQRRYHFTARHDFSVDLAGAPPSLTRDTLADVWLEVRTQGEPETARVRVGGAPYSVRRETNDGAATHQSTTVHITPYYTFKQGNASLVLELFDATVHRRLVQLMRRRVPLRRSRGQRPIWLLGERRSQAQDNALHLFRYLRAHRPDIDAYYVITPDAPDRRALAGLDHVVDFRSAEHLDLVVRADRIVSTHHPDLLYPTRSRRFMRLVRAPEVFLQHGVMGTKWMVPNYGKRGRRFHTDLFCVSSERERSYIITDFGYAPSEVAVTGLARFDALFGGDVEVVPRQILVMPTWRDWLQDEEIFLASDYLDQWRGFLADKRLAELLERNDAHVLVYLHANMQRYADHMAALIGSARVRLVRPDEADVQFLLKQSAVMITDYSSPGFDFAFLDKPVLYFQFDRARFLGRQGSHLDLDAELPGRVALDRDRALSQLAQVLAEGCVIGAEHRRRADRFIAHRDRRNCERIVAAVESATRNESRRSALERSEAVSLAARRLRRSRYYFPMMRRLFRVIRRTPMDENLIVFESGVGKQYGDSPRYLYEELVRRGDRRTKVWVYNKAIPVEDPSLVVVRRLSPRYFYYLAKAKYWVNNQNFPHYIHRRPQGVYLQTWHGTPLKRMLNDLDHIVGRDAGYAGRVAEANSQWSLLLSPSPYATRAFRSAFGYQGRILEVGYPRNDVLVSDRAAELRSRIRHRLDLPEGRRVILYAPTFRDNAAAKRGFRFELPFDVEEFARTFGADTTLLLRMHVLIANKVEIPESARHCVLDVSAYPEIQELHLASDALVTDYSSVLFDYALLGRPIILYAYDLETYRDDLRGFYLDYLHDLPGPVARTQDELFAAIADTACPAPQDLQRIRDFAARYGPHEDGHAARRVVNQVFGTAHDDEE